MDTAIKWLSAGYPVHELLFTNALFALVPVVVVSLRRGGLARLRTRLHHLHVLRGVFGMGGGFSPSTPIAGCRWRMPTR